MRRRGPRRVAGAVAIAVLLAVPAAARADGGSAGAAAATPAAAPVLLVAVPDLRWTDLAHMPTVRSMLAAGAVGELSVRAEGESTRCGDGLLELSAGTRVPSGLGACPPDPAVVAAARDRYRHDRFGAQVGLLGRHLGDRAAALDDAAAVLLTGSAPPPTRAARAAAAFAAGARLVVAVDAGIYAAEESRRGADHTADRAATAGRVDGLVAAQTRGLPPGVVVVLAGISDGPRGGPHLHPVVVTGAGWKHRELTSPTTGRAPYVQLFDLTATLLALSGRTELPTSMSGRAMHPSAEPVRPVASYADIDRHARRALQVGHPTVTALCAVLLGVLLLVALRRREAVWVARLLVFAPAATWLVQLLPWWRWPVAAYAAVVGLIALAAALAPVAATTVVTAAVLGVDQLAGAPLQLAAPLGDNPLVAGRFHGMGNLDFGVFAASMLLCAAMAAGRVARLDRRGPVRRQAAGAAAAVAAVAVVVDGAPMLGADVGGVLALLPAAAVLVSGLLGARITRLRAAAIIGAAVVAAVAIGLIDYSRPAARQTHAGRFIGQVLHGGAGRVLQRKLDAVLASFGNPVVTALVVVAALALLLLLRREGGRAERERVGSVAPGPTAPTAAVAAPDVVMVPIGVLAVAGSALNDSGIFVAAAAALVLVPRLVASRQGILER